MPPSIYSWCKTGHLAGVRAALARGEAVNTRGDYQSTCLMAAVCSGHEEVVALLLERPDCDVALVDGLGRTALHHACHLGRAGMVRTLVVQARAQGSLDTKDNWGFTPLMAAVEQGREDCARELGQLAGVDLCTRDWRGRGLGHRTR